MIRPAPFPDHVVLNLRRFGIVCYKKLYSDTIYFSFAWQVCENLSLWLRFDALDRDFLQTLAHNELKDDWYRYAGEKLSQIGFERFIESTQESQLEQMFNMPAKV